MLSFDVPNTVKSRDVVHILPVHPVRLIKIEIWRQIPHKLLQTVALEVMKTVIIFCRKAVDYHIDSLENNIKMYDHIASMCINRMA